jgi:hypothetical protein
MSRRFLESLERQSSLESLGQFTALLYDNAPPKDMTQAAHLYDLQQFARDYPPQWNKRGFIIDDRWNHGGDNDDEGRCQEFTDYDPKKYPTWEFRLVLRDPNDRRQVRKIKSIEFGPGDVAPTENADGTAVKEFIGQRVPRGELAYDQARGLAIVRVLGLRSPISVEVPIDGR